MKTQKSPAVLKTCTEAVKQCKETETSCRKLLEDIQRTDASLSNKFSSAGNALRYILETCEKISKETYESSGRAIIFSSICCAISILCSLASLLCIFFS